MVDEFQFFPTPAGLAARMIAKFSTHPWGRDARVLEPSAGDGALVRALVDAAKAERNAWMVKHHTYFRMDDLHVDFIELDMGKHDALKSIDDVRGEVIGLDFLQFSGSLAAYTHVLANPPFAAGVHHLLKAWDGLFDGEIVCLLNAETIKNPFSKERQRLVRLIEAHGDVEFIQDAFKGEGVEREADVEVAIVRLAKKADLQRDIIGSVLDSLAEDSLAETGGAGDAHAIGDDRQLAIPGDVIVRTERAFKAAVTSMRECVIAQARASYAARLVGQTLAQRNGEDKGDTQGDLIQTIREGIAKGYDELKDRAWSEVLRSTEVSAKLSSKAQQRLEADFQRIKRLDFSASNVYSFLIGLIDARGDMLVQMACEVFDEITRYHSENRVYYEGWKSNDRHRTAGWRIKHTRFILPHFKADYSWSKRPSYSMVQRLADFDKVFAALDGKEVSSIYGLSAMFERECESLAHGERRSSAYFDVRWYPGKGTVHIFPRNQQIMDRLNRLVGRTRDWLPPRDEMVAKDFWLAYERAEKFDEEVRAEAARMSPGVSIGAVTGPEWGDESRTTRAQHAVASAFNAIARKHGLDPLPAIASSHKEPEQLPLLAIAA